MTNSARARSATCAVAKPRRGSTRLQGDGLAGVERSRGAHEGHGACTLANDQLHSGHDLFALGLQHLRAFYRGWKISIVGRSAGCADRIELRPQRRPGERKAGPQRLCRAQTAWNAPATARAGAWSRSLRLPCGSPMLCAKPTA